MCIGTDMAYEHDGAPEGLLEAFGVAEGARTVGEARMTATADVVLSIPDVGGGSPDLGLVLWLNYDMEEARVFNRLDREMRITRARFAREEYDRPWRSNAIDDSNGFVAGWGYDRAAFVGFDQESRERIGLLNVAVVGNGLAFAFSAAPACTYSSRTGSTRTGASTRSSARSRPRASGSAAAAIPTWWWTCPPRPPWDRADVTGGARQGGAPRRRQGPPPSGRP